MCEEVNVSCKVISGKSKDSDIFASLNSDDPDKPGHAWNAVFIRGSWILCDLTWAAGSGRKKSEKKYWDHYFFCTPEVFVFNYFPSESKWQLLKQSILYEQFCQSVHFCGLNNVFPKIHKKTLI